MTARRENVCYAESIHAKIDRSVFHDRLWPRLFSSIRGKIIIPYLLLTITVAVTGIYVVMTLVTVRWMNVWIRTLWNPDLRFWMAWRE